MTLMYLEGCYSIPNITARGHLCKTHLQPRVAMRAAGSPQAHFFIENVVREVAGYLKIPAHQVRHLFFCLEFLIRFTGLLNTFSVFMVFGILETPVWQGVQLFSVEKRLIVK